MTVDDRVVPSAAMSRLVSATHEELFAEHRDLTSTAHGRNPSTLSREDAYRLAAVRFQIDLRQLRLALEDVDSLIESLVTQIEKAYDESEDGRKYRRLMTPAEIAARVRESAARWRTRATSPLAIPAPSVRK